MSKNRYTEDSMSKYEILWKYIRDQGSPTFDEVRNIAGSPLDHSFLKYKKELSEYGFEVSKILMKAQTVLFVKKESKCI